MKGWKLNLVALWNKNRKYANILKFAKNWLRTDQSLEGKRKAIENAYC